MTEYKIDFDEFQTNCFWFEPKVICKQPDGNGKCNKDFCPILTEEKKIKAKKDNHTEENKMNEKELIGIQQLQIENDKIIIEGHKQRSREIANIITKDNGLKDKIELIYAVSLEGDVKDILNLCY